MPRQFLLRLQKWAAAAEKDSPCGGTDRLQVAKKCISSIELRLMKPAFLLTTVRRSRLGKEQEVFESLTKQAEKTGEYVSLATMRDVNGLYEEVPVDDDDPCRLMNTGKTFKV